MEEALRQVGINPDFATPPGERQEQEQPEQPEEQGGATPPQRPAPPQGGGSSPERDAAVKAIDDAIKALRDAQTKGDFAGYGAALDRLNEAVTEYESLPGQN